LSKAWSTDCQSIRGKSRIGSPLHDPGFGQSLPSESGGRRGDHAGCRAWGNRRGTGRRCGDGHDRGLLAIRGALGSARAPADGNQGRQGQNQGQFAQFHDGISSNWARQKPPRLRPGNGSGARSRSAGSRRGFSIRGRSDCPCVCAADKSNMPTSRQKGNRLPCLPGTKDPTCDIPKGRSSGRGAATGTEGKTRKNLRGAAGFAGNAAWSIEADLDNHVDLAGRNVCTGIRDGHKIEIERNAGLFGVLECRLTCACAGFSSGPR
jgi:hypothetical protein